MTTKNLVKGGTLKKFPSGVPIRRMETGKSNSIRPIVFGKEILLEGSSMGAAEE